MSTTTIPEWARGSAAYRSYLEASQVCADAMAGIAVKPANRLSRYWLTINGHHVNRSNLYRSEFEARVIGRKLIANGWTPAPTEPAEAATRPQIEHITDLIARRRNQGDTGKYMTPADIAALSKDEASVYISNLRTR
jgi:hypothetical protein